MNNTILEYLGKLFVKFLPGSKTYLLGAVTMIIGIYNMIVELNIIQELCVRFGICLEGNAVWGVVVTVIGFLIRIFRKSTELEMKPLSMKKVG